MPIFQKHGAFALLTSLTLLSLSFSFAAEEETAPRNTQRPELDVTAIAVLAPTGRVIQGDLPEEPTVSQMREVWRSEQTNADCALLGIVNSRAKFISFWNGAISTLFYTDIPAKADLLRRGDESLLVLFGVGEKPDWRLNETAQVEQHFADGWLPIVVSQWQAEELHLRQTAFGCGMDSMRATRGDENSVSLVALDITNPSDKPCIAKISLALLAGMDRVPMASDRTIDVAPYSVELTFDESGKIWHTDKHGEKPLLRAALDLPKGAKIRSEINPDFRPTTWDADTTPNLMGRPLSAFNGNAFQGGWWAPGGGPADVGVQWTEPSEVRQVEVFFDSNSTKNMTTENAPRLEVMINDQWQPIQAAPLHEPGLIDILSHRATQVGCGFGNPDGWTWAFAPIRCQAIRMIIKGKGAAQASAAGPAGEPPIAPPPGLALQEMVIEYRHDSDENWQRTNEGLIDRNRLVIDVPVPAEATCRIVAKFPFLAAENEEAKRIETMKFDHELAKVTQFWRDQIAQGQRLTLPDKDIENAVQQGIVFNYLAPEIPPQLGKVILNGSVGWYESVFGSVATISIATLDEAGHHDEAALLLDTFMHWQGTLQPAGEYESKEGFLAATAGYSPLIWTAQNGYILSALARHYLLTADKAWLQEALPHLLKSVDWIERERARTKVLDEKGARRVGWGLLPGGVWCDAGTIDQYWFIESWNWRGMDDTARVLEAIGHERAAEVRAAANDYHQCILSAVETATNAAAPLKLPDGTETPNVPVSARDSRGAAAFPSLFVDVGPVHLIETECLSSRSPLAGAMMMAAEGYSLRRGVSIFEPVYSPHRLYYLDQDWVHKFIEMAWSYRWAGLGSRLYTGMEEYRGIQLMPCVNAEFVRMIQRLLFRFKDKELILLEACPREWLKDGEVVAIENAPSEFGVFSCQVESHVGKGYMNVVINPPARHPSVPTRLRLRHPDRKPIRAVEPSSAVLGINGEWIALNPMHKRVKLKVKY